MAVSYESACQTLERMFPQIEPLAIRTVLEAHHGHVEQTVESLLSISGAESGSSQPKAESSTARERHTGTEQTDEEAGTSGTQTHEQLERDEMLAMRLQRQLNTGDRSRSHNDDPWGFFGIESRHPRGARHNVEPYEQHSVPVVDLQDSLNSGWKWMQDSTTWLSNYVQESLSEMMEEHGTNPNADILDSPSPHANLDTPAQIEHLELTRAARPTRPPAGASRRLQLDQSSDSIRDRRAHRPDEISPQEDAQQSGSRGRPNASSSHPPEIKTTPSSFDGLIETDGLLGFLGMAPTGNSKKEK
mmetsp:Transcript_26792/g.44925  ORF Transcript_26792/g.44925 Transcript_26792/m.44925 type:complete len:302 (-) Transcript_26792:480-1385(-)|eukprot:CAMPEP_0198205006 /NCGR_PEP_ID=MMETSP1445-20131203/8488_1 /TAXON_ID=36898 /ORGANISM="Pyramimonas sp., Strain CCMP2087" /LENGTH=301 /DNA_ID=CAMNT_0043877135 /DNA_START=161 /DNA_END=1066 /DNA_ORIENTATION=-